MEIKAGMEGREGGEMLQRLPWQSSGCWNREGNVWGQQKSGYTMLWFPGKPNLGLWSHISAGFIILPGFRIMNWLLMDAAASSLPPLARFPLIPSPGGMLGALGAPTVPLEGLLLHPHCGILLGGACKDQLSFLFGFLHN